MRIAIYGTGGVGGYFGGQLARAGEDVTFIARGEHLEALRSTGLRVESVNGDFTLRPVNATNDPAEPGVVDVVILGVKAWQVSEAADALRPLLGPETFVVSLQNGVEAASELAAVLGTERVLPGLAKVISFIDRPGCIRRLGGPCSVAFAEVDNRPSERVERLRAAFERTGVAVEIPPDIWVALWAKFLFIVPVGGLGAVTRAPIGVLRSVPETRQIMEAAMREILWVAQANGIPLADETIERTLSFVDTLPPDSTSSLQRDIAARRPSELEAWNGAAVRLGQRTGVPTPSHSFIYHSLLPLERRARGELQFPD